MSDLTYAEWRDQWDVLMTEEERERVRAKCQWEHMTPWQVLNDWPSLRAEAFSLRGAPRGELPAHAPLPLVFV